MATLAKQITCFFLIILSTCCPTQARQSKFFSKYAHLSTSNYVTVPSSTNLKINVPSSPTPSSAPITSQISGVPASAPVGGSSPAPAPAPTTLGDEENPSPAPTTLGSEYSSVSAPVTLGAGESPGSAPTTLGTEYSPTPAPPTAEDEIPHYGLYGKNANEKEEEEFSTEDPEELNNNREANTYSNNNGFLTSNYKRYYDTNNGYDFNSKPQGMSYTRIEDNNKYYDTEHGNYSPIRHESEPQGIEDNSKYYYNPSRPRYDIEPQGMSDTRMVDNAKYSPLGLENNNEEGYYYGGSYKKSKYEFDSMEEYEKQQGYADVQQEFINP